MKKSIIISLFAALTVTSFTSCLDTESERFVSADKELTLQDSVYQMLGVLTNIKNLADRYVVLGEVRGDLVTTTQYATSDLKELNDITISKTNSYVSKKEYYKVINQCNYIIKYGRALPKERAAAITLRAWTYLQMVLNYGTVKYYEDFIDTDAAANADYPSYNLDDMITALVPQLEEIRDIRLPSYGKIGGVEIKTQLLNAKFILGDLYLWAGKYELAAQMYYDLIQNKTTGEAPFLATVPYKASTGGVDSYENYPSFIKWTSERYQPQNINMYWGRFLNRESISTIAIPVPDSCTVKSEIDTLFGAPYYTEKEYISLTATSAATSIWRTSEYAYVEDEDQYSSSAALMYVLPQKANYDNPGDLRLMRSYSNMLPYTTSSSVIIDDSVVVKYFSPSGSNTNKQVTLCRIATLYLRYAEAVNRAGKPGLAMIALKYGLNADNINMYMPDSEKPEPKYMDEDKTIIQCAAFSYDKQRKQLLRKDMSVTLPKAWLDAYDWVVPVTEITSGSFGLKPGSDTLYYCFNDQVDNYYDFKSTYFDNNFGLHSRGSGCASADTTYMMPGKKYPGDMEKQMIYMDSVICNEYAYETAFEGNRFQDLMRFSRYQNNPDFLLERMKKKSSTIADRLKVGRRVWDCKNWYLLPDEVTK